jgi:hypothetical protein
MTESRPFILRSPTFAALWRTEDDPSLPPSPPPLVTTVRSRRTSSTTTGQIASLPLSVIAYPPAITALQPTIGFDKLWRWVKERHAIYTARQEGKPSPWTSDSVVSQYKFANIYRELDRESQACIRIANSGASLENFEEQFFRTILFKTFNLDSTWRLLTVGLNEEPRLGNFELNRYCQILPGEGIYSNAYYGAFPCTDKEWADVGLAREKTAKKFHLRVVQMMIEHGTPAKAFAAKSLDDIAALLQEFPRIGDFKAGQFALDLNYGPPLRLPVGNFVIAGPGARNGINNCFSAHGKRHDAVIAFGLPVPRRV